MGSISFGDGNRGFQIGKNDGHLEFHLPSGKSGIGHCRKVGLLNLTFENIGVSVHKIQNKRRSRIQACVRY